MALSETLSGVAVFIAVNVILGYGLFSIMAIFTFVIDCNNGQVQLEV